MIPPGVQVDLENAKVVVAWATGRGQRVIYGEGEISDDGSHWSLILDERLPDEYLFLPQVAIGGPLKEGIHGMGAVYIVSDDLDEGDVLPPNIVLGREIYGLLNPYEIIYYTGKEIFTEWTSPWIDAFPTGYAVGIPGFQGYVPVQEREYPIQIFVR